MSSKAQKSCHNQSDDNLTVSKKSSLDRFGDDLIELILSYLPISDKLRMECLSKQVQSLIFNKQRCLRISHVQSYDNLKEIISKPNKTSRYQSVNYTALETVLRKFKCLDTIRVEGRMSCDWRLIETIADNCRQLKNLWINVRYVTDITNECLKDFGHKCGPTLQSLKFDGLTDKQMRQLLSSTPELRSITADSLKTVVTDSRSLPHSRGADQWVEGLPKFLPKLQEIQFCRCNEKVLNQFQTEYSDNLLKITTHLLTLDLRADAMTRALTGFGRFHKLRALDLFIDVCDDSDVKSIDNGLRQLAEECLQLRQLSFTLDGNLLQNNNLYSIFSTFKSLSSLEINITIAEMDDNPVYNYGSIRDFRHLSQLKHLSLTLEQLSDDCIENIDKYLPQLVSIRFNTTKAITDRSLRHLSRLKCLAKLEIICFTAEEDNNITNEGVQELIDKCGRIRSLSFDQKNLHFDFGISEESIEAMISRSKRMPKIQYNFSFAVNKNEKSIQLFNRLNNLPPNLSIEIL